MLCFLFSIHEPWVTSLTNLHHSDGNVCVCVYTIVTKKQHIDNTQPRTCLTRIASIYLCRKFNLKNMLQNGTEWKGQIHQWLRGSPRVPHGGSSFLSLSLSHYSVRR